MFTADQINTWVEYQRLINEKYYLSDPATIAGYNGLLFQMTPSEIESVVKMALLHNDLYGTCRRDRSKELLSTAATLVGGMIRLIAHEVLEKLQTLSFQMSDLGAEEVDHVFKQVESITVDFKDVTNVLVWYAGNISDQTVISSHIHRQCVRHAISALKNFK